jgi:predicted dehydrogenase/threonine dehydrogenase-like Zn-dependent dehydrogenase
MKQIVQNLATGETTLLDVPVPKPGQGMALVRNVASLVSAGTERMLVEFAAKSLVGKARSRPDLVRQTLDKARREGLLSTFDAVRNRLDQPLPLGYSSAGNVVAVGDGLRRFQVGDRVACAGGGYAVHAEYVAVPENLLAILPQSVQFEEGAFATLGAIALHGFRLAKLQVGEQVAVIGLGLLGLLTIQIAQAAGCKVFGADPNAKRVDLAQQFGAQAVLREGAEDVGLDETSGVGFDAVLICADTNSNDPVNLAGEIARDKARIVAVGAVGMEIPRKVYYEKELDFTVSRSYGPGRYDPSYEEKGWDYPIGYVRWTEGRNLQAFLELLGSGRLNVGPLISHRFPIERGLEAYDLITGKVEEPFLGVILTYSDGAEGDRELSKVTLLHPASAEATRPVCLGVLGAGNFATAVMLPVLRRMKGLDRIAIASASGLSGRHAADRYSFRYTTTEEKQILEDEDINTLAILTRHHLHARQVMAGLRAGKHVFCEKPLALNEDQLTGIVETLKDADGRLMVGFNRRFAPLSRKLVDFLGPCHSPLAMHYRVNAGFLPTDHWLHDPEQGGGRIIGEACHFIDYLTFLTNATPVQVRTVGLPGDERSHEDNVVITISFSDGSLGTVTYLSNGDRAFPKERLEVFCGGRVAVLDDFRTLEMVARGKRRIRRSHLRQDKGHKAAWEAFVECLTHGDPPPIPYAQLISVTMASFAAVQSLRMQMTVPVGSLPLG